MGPRTRAHAGFDCIRSSAWKADRGEFDIRLEPFRPLLASETRVFHAAKRRIRTNTCPVDLDCPCFDARRDAYGALDVPREDCAAEAKLRVVGNGDCLLVSVIVYD